MRTQVVRFSVVSHAAWAPGLTTADLWRQWAAAPYAIATGAEPGVKAMPPMLRRRAGTLGKMALEVAYECLDGRGDVPTVFCSRHGEVGRALDLLSDLARGDALSPTAFGMAVHNATAGLFTIARADRANHIALAAGAATVEHAVIEACGLLADGAPAVLLVACDCPLPELMAGYADADEQPHAWAWLMTAADGGDGADTHADTIALSWTTDHGADAAIDVAIDGTIGAPTGATAADFHAGATPGSLAVLAFHLSGARAMERVAAQRRWRWSRDA